MVFTWPEVLWVIITWLVIVWLIIWAWRFTRYIVRQGQNINAGHEWQNGPGIPKPPPGI